MTPSDRRIAIIRNEFARQLISIKKTVNWADFEPDPEDDGLPHLCVTFGANEDLSGWGYQTGDNSYTGGAYGFKYWGLCYLGPRTNSKEAATEVLDQILGQIAQS